jgi:archaellum biogenesis ATPase FlaH
MLKTLVKLGAQGLALSTTYSSKLKKTYGLNNVEVRWFTDTTSEDGTIDPKRLEFEATRTISNFIKEMETAVIMIDGLEYLVVENGFDNVLRFIKKINDISSVNGATLIMNVNPKAMSPDELTVLMKDFDVIEDLSKDKKHTT